LREGWTSMSWIPPAPTLSFHMHKFTYNLECLSHKNIKFGFVFVQYLLLPE
jgi:hypothetical protein